MPEALRSRLRRACHCVPWPVAIAATLLVAAWVTRPAGRPAAPRPHQARNQDTPDAPEWEQAPPVELESIPRLRMPFPAGSVVMCGQGNQSGGTRTHSLPQNMHALDFANWSAPEMVVVAAASGIVAYVVRDAGTDPDAGAGYGRQVRLVHEEHLFTLYVGSR